MIHIILGTKAQLIKMAPIMAELQRQNIPFNYISTGQHRDTMAEIIQCFAIKTPDYTLYQGKDITSISAMFVWSIKIIGHALRHKKLVFQQDKQGIVLVHGDTFSTLLGALIGKIAGLKVGHVEAGLRSFNLFHPFPEELTRLLVFRFADYLFCPGQMAMNHVKNYRAKKINTQHNTITDALALALPHIDKQVIDIPHQPFAIVTLHRFENISHEKAIQRIIHIVENISQHYLIVFILHKPTKMKLKKFNLYQQLEDNPRIELRPRYDYFQFIKLIQQSLFVISDGGSNQEECAYLGKPILLLRQATERPDGLNSNCVLSQYDDTIITNFLDNVSSYQQPKQQLAQSPTTIIIDHCKPFA